MDFTSAHKSILLLGLSDYIDMGGVIFRVIGGGYIFTNPLPTGVQEQALQVLKDLLQEDLVEAGIPHFRREDFEAWNLSTQEIIKRINSEWGQLGRTPIVGDIVWFRLTSRGEKIAKEIEQQEQDEPGTPQD